MNEINEPEEIHDNHNIICPYCLTKFWHVDEDVDEDASYADCDECGKQFAYRKSVSIAYISSPVKQPE